jgi:eukaryotic-like serine/threonine-protein kinase
MLTTLSPGDSVGLAAYRRCKVDSLIGAGGQGEVYRVVVEGLGGGRSHALKWYFPEWSTPQQWNVLQELVRQEPPNPRFLWPLDIARSGERSSFGYLMDLRPERFQGFVELMSEGLAPTFRSLARTAFQLADGFLQLHSLGLCYRDISFGNIFFDPATGDALICDNDNVGIDGQAVVGIQGTPGFMAPEIVRGEAVPTRATDLYSLAVLLFHMWMVHHPLLGRRELEYPILDAEANYQLYGADPVFIFDPNDRSNEPIAGIHTNALAFWPLYPRFLTDLFVQAFTDGLWDPGSRVQETEWRRAMLRLGAAVVLCDRCQVELFWDEVAGTAPRCWKCDHLVRLPLRLSVAGAPVRKIMLNHDTQIWPEQLAIRTGFDRPLADVRVHPVHAGLWGLRNLSGAPWQATLADGTAVTVDADRAISLDLGTRIDFGGTQGTIER